jgi:hypothetical protein
MSAPRGVQRITLAELQGFKRSMDEGIKRHRPQCANCEDRLPCAWLKKEKRELAVIKDALVRWNDPPPDQESLF